MTTRLFSDRLTLRRFTPADADNLFALDADPEVMRFITGGSGTARAVIKKQILPRFIREQDQAGVFGFWAAELTNAFIGWFSLRRLDGLPEEASLGYRLQRSAWDRGLATEGARLLVERVFLLSDVEKVLATTYEDNLGSIAVMKKLGMQFQRSFHMDAASIEAMDTATMDPAEAFPGDDVEYAVSRAQWLEARRQR